MYTICLICYSMNGFLVNYKSLKIKNSVKTLKRFNEIIDKIF